LRDAHDTRGLTPAPRKFEQIDIVRVGQTSRVARMLSHVRSCVGKDFAGGKSVCKAVRGTQALLSVA
jgi:hypothetical protein